MQMTATAFECHSNGCIPKILRVKDWVKLEIEFVQFVKNDNNYSKSCNHNRVSFSLAIQAALRLPAC